MTSSDDTPSLSLALSLACLFACLLTAVTFTGSSVSYTAPFEEGDVVGFGLAGLTRKTRGLRQLGVITRRAVVEGSMPSPAPSSSSSFVGACNHAHEGSDEEKSAPADEDGSSAASAAAAASVAAARKDYDTVAYCGRVPVKLRGGAALHDYLTPSGLEDGTAVAWSQESSNSQDRGCCLSRVGRALQPVEEEEATGKGEVNNLRQQPAQQSVRLCVVSVISPAETVIDPGGLDPGLDQLVWRLAEQIFTVVQALAVWLLKGCQSSCSSAEVWRGRGTVSASSLAGQLPLTGVFVASLCMIKYCVTVVDREAQICFVGIVGILFPAWWDSQKLMPAATVGNTGCEANTSTANYLLSVLALGLTVAGILLICFASSTTHNGGSSSSNWFQVCVGCGSTLVGIWFHQRQN